MFPSVLTIRKPTSQSWGLFFGGAGGCFRGRLDFRHFGIERGRTAFFRERSREKSYLDGCGDVLHSVK